ncbi:hypothetical protein ABGB07_14950 [Micromonosporaceae bacterium B7E4]
MSDYDWFSAESIEAATDGIRAEAKKWFGFSDKMETIAQSMASLTLQPTAFLVIDPGTAAMTMTDQYGAYHKTHGWLTGLFQDATTKFDEFGNALNKCADEYDRTDGRSKASFDEIANA